MTLIFKKIKTFTFIFLIFINLIFSSKAHMKGTYDTRQEAEKKSFQLGCGGIHKNQDKWLPCENEKELHRYLRK